MKKYHHSFEELEGLSKKISAGSFQEPTLNKLLAELNAITAKVKYRLAEEKPVSEEYMKKLDSFVGMAKTSKPQLPGDHRYNRIVRKHEPKSD